MLEHPSDLTLFIFIFLFSILRRRNARDMKQSVFSWAFVASVPFLFSLTTATSSDGPTNRNGEGGESNLWQGDIYSALGPNDFLITYTDVSQNVPPDTHGQGDLTTPKTIRMQLVDFNDYFDIGSPGSYTATYHFHSGPVDMADVSVLYGRNLQCMFAYGRKRRHPTIHEEQLRTGAVVEGPLRGVTQISCV